MKRLDDFRDGVLLAGQYLVKLADHILRPLKDIPVPDFNRQYDPTIL